MHRGNKWNSAITFIGCEHFTREASLPSKSWHGSPLYSYWLWTFSIQLGLVMSKQQNCFGLLTQELWPPGHKCYSFIAHLENSIPLSPQQSLLGVQVGHFPLRKKGCWMISFSWYAWVALFVFGSWAELHGTCRRLLFPWSLWTCPFKASIFDVCTLIFDVR